MHTDVNSKTLFYQTVTVAPGVQWTLPYSIRECTKRFIDGLWGHKHYHQERSITCFSNNLQEGKGKEFTLKSNLRVKEEHPESEKHDSILIRGVEANHQITNIPPEQSDGFRRRREALEIVKPPPWNDEH
jgi:hypothetical protein